MELRSTTARACASMYLHSSFRHGKGRYYKRQRAFRNLGENRETHRVGHPGVFQDELHLRHMTLTRDDPGRLQQRLWHEPGIASIHGLSPHDAPYLLHEQDLPISVYQHRWRLLMRANAEPLPPGSLVDHWYTQPLLNL